MITAILLCGSMLIGLSGLAVIAWVSDWVVKEKHPAGGPGER